MIITIHRGSREIGGSCVEIEGKSGTRLLVDVGLPLVDTGAATLALTGKYDGVLISHAHQDHYGLLSTLPRDLPFHVSAPTAQLIEITARFTGSDYAIGNPVIFQSHRPFTCGEFRITPYLTDHSAFDAHGFLIDDGERRVFYSGDFRGHGRKAALLERFEQHPPSPVDALLLEGTTLGRCAERFISEAELEGKIVGELSATAALAVVCASGQNIDRLVTLVRACQRTGRKLLVDPYIAHVLGTLHAFNPKIPIPTVGGSWPLGVYYPPRLCRHMRLRREMGEVLDASDAVRVYPAEIVRSPGRYLLLVRETMIKDLSRELGRSADNALFLYGLWRGYWEEDKMPRLSAWVAERNMNHVYAHTSGHACPETLRRFADALQPRRIIPIHTACPEAYAGFLTQHVQTASDGEPIILQ